MNLLSMPPSSGDSPDIMRRYQSRPMLLGYPAAEGFVPPQTKRHAADFRQTLRITAFDYGDVTPEQAEELAAKWRSQGLTLIIAEGNRYLFKDGNEVLATAIKAPVLEKIIANTKVLVEACHRHGLRFFHHLTSTMVSPHLLELHPDWKAIDLLTGESPTNVYGTSNTCINNDSFMQAFFERLDRLQRETRADGVMQDEIQFFSPTLCGCPSCREKFKSEASLDLPQPGDTEWFSSKNPDYHAWLAWRHEKVIERNQQVRQIMLKYVPDATDITYICNNSAYWNYYASGFAVDGMPRFADSIGYECEPPDFLYQYYWPHMAAEMKYLRAVAENIPTAPWTLFYNPTAGDYTWNWLLSTSQGSRVWWLLGEPWQNAAAEPLLAWEARHEELMANLKTEANIAVPFSITTRNNYPYERPRDWTHGYASTVNALMDGHVPFRVLIDADLKAATLTTKRVKTLLLFDMTNITDGTAAEIRQFVRQGGTVIASAATSLFTENRTKRTDFALADVFGCHYGGEVEQGKWLHIPAANGVTGDVVGDLPHADNFVVVKNVAPEARQLGTMIAADGKTYPGIIAHRYGKGKAVYFAGHPEYKYLYYYYNSDIDIKPGKFWKDNREPQYGRLLCNVARYANAEIPVQVDNVPSGVLVESYRQESGRASGVQVHLVNFLGGRLQEGIVPVRNAINFPEVKPNLPDPHKPITIGVRAADVNGVYVVSPDFDEVVQLPFTETNGYTTVVLPALYRYALVYFNQGDSSLFRELAGGRVAGTMPAAKPLRYEDALPLVGAYDLHAAVAFAGTPALRAGVPTQFYKSEEGQTVYGAQSDETTMTATLHIPTLPANAVLEIGAMDHNQPYAVTDIEIKLNGKVLVSGKTKARNEEWSVVPFSITAADLVVGENTVEIKNLADGPLRGMPAFTVNFVRIRPA